MFYYNPVKLRRMTVAAKIEKNTNFSFLTRNIALTATSSGALTRFVTKFLATSMNETPS